MYEPGSVLAGKYRIERALGRGGMGVVLAAEHIELRATVAVKCLHASFAGRDDVVKRFLREARASARLTSEHACRVFDVGKLETGVPYFVMEMLHGSDLAGVLRTSGRLDVATAAAYVRQACDAIQEAHAARIIHRDLKPGNLFLTQRRDGAPLVKVLDFGVAKAPDDGDFTLTSAEAVVGSPAYMAPEQIRASKVADERSDIWSLGVILYELVSGKQPFQSASIGDLAIRISTEPVQPLHDAPIGFAMIVARCLEKDPANRFQSAGELAQALAACSAPLQVAAPTPVPSPRPATAPTAAPPPETLTTYAAPAGPAVSTTLRSASGSIASTRAALGSRRAFVIAGVAAMLIGLGFAVLLGPLSSDRDAPHVIAPETAPAASTPGPSPIPAAPTATSAAPTAMPAPSETPPAAPSGSPTSVAAPGSSSSTGAASSAPIDAGGSPVAKPVPAEDRPPAPPPRRPTRTKSKEQIGESRI